MARIYVDKEMYLSQSDIQIKNLVNRSTDEQVVGRWVDGRPIYKKIFVGEAVGGGQVNITHNIPNLDNYHWIGPESFICYSGTSSPMCMINTTENLGLQWRKCVFTNVQFEMFVGEWTVGPTKPWVYSIAAYYTKTTDL